MAGSSSGDRIRPWADPTADASGFVEAWEPCLRLDPTAMVPVLYEPEGALYGICLGTGCEVATDRRRVALGMLDLIVVAPGLAVDLAPPSRFLVLRHLGPPPPHFRERFVQVWGFEHVAAGEGPSVVDPDTAGHRLRYEVLDLSAGTAPVALDAQTLGLVVAGEGDVSVVANSDPEGGRLLPAGESALIEPGTAFTLRGDGRVGLVSVVPEILHEARARERRRRGQVSRVDYSPPPGRSGGLAPDGA